MGQWIDRDQSKVYRAETLWAAAFLNEDLIDDLDHCRPVLEDHVHPALLDRVAFEQIKGRTGDTLGQLVYTEWYQFRLRVVLPVAPSTILHEAAHLLLEACGGTDLHNADFRRTHLWLVERHYGLLDASRLATAYQDMGLK